MMKRIFAALGVLSLLAVPVIADETAAPAGAAPAAAAPAAEAPATAPVAKKASKAAMGGDEEGVKAAFERFSQAWAAGDAKARAMVFTNDGSIINPFGQEAWGRAEIVKLFEDENATIAKGTTQTFDNFKMTFVLPNLALVDCDGTISGIKTPAGDAAPDQKVHVFVVAVKRGKDWQCRYARPTIFAPMPGAAPAAAAPAAADPAMPAKDSAAPAKKADGK